MKKRTLALILALAIITTALVAFAAGAGSEDDPLVSKSYVDQAIEEVKELIGSLEGSGDTNPPEDNPDITIPTYTVVNVPAKKKLVCDGGTEVILRSGTATIMASELGGVSDVTAGLDLQEGQSVTTNHHLIVPRSDGRGLKATSDIIVMVKGDYTIK